MTLRLHRTPTCCVPAGPRWAGLRGQGTLHSGHLPAQLPVGPCPPVGPGEPRVAGPGLGGWGRTRRCAIHRGPGLHHLRDLWVRHHGYTSQRGYHPLLATAASSGDVLMARLREGRANTARGAAHFLRETLGRVRSAGATGQITVRADSGFYTHSIVALQDEGASPSPSVRARACAISSRPTRVGLDDYWMEGAADVAE